MAWAKTGRTLAGIKDNRKEKSIRRKDWLKLDDKVKEKSALTLKVCGFLLCKLC